VQCTDCVARKCRLGLVVRKRVLTKLLLDRIFSHIAGDLEGVSHCFTPRFTNMNKHYASLFSFALLTGRGHRGNKPIGSSSSSW